MKRRIRRGLAGFLATVLTISLAPASAVQAAKKPSLNKKKLKITVGETGKLKLKNNKKKVSWKIASGKKYIKLKAKKKTGVTIKAIKQGTARVQAVIGKKKYTCKVTVKEASKKTVTTQAPTSVSIPTMKPTSLPTIEPTPLPTGKPDEADLDSADVAALRAFIETLKGAGEAVSDDILDHEQYTWDVDGYLTEINWSSDAGAVLKGGLVFSGLLHLEILSVAGTDISSLDVSACIMLNFLDCSGCKKLTALNVSGCKELGALSCTNTALTKLDLSGCPYLEEDYVDSADTLDVTYYTLNINEKELKALEELVASLIENNGAPESIAVWVWERNENTDAGEKEGKGGQWVLNEDCYDWDVSGHLSRIYWDGYGIQGEISLSAFTHLTYVDIYENALTALDLSGCSRLEELDCSNQIENGEYTLTSLKLTGCSALTSLNCSGCALTVLDISDCVNLDISEDSDSFIYDASGVEIITEEGALGGDALEI